MIKITGYLNPDEDPASKKPLEERCQPLDEMSMIGAKDDKVLGDIDIYVFGRETEVPHAVILARRNHQLQFGRFIITSKAPPKSADDVIPVNESISREHKDRIVLWARKRSNRFFKNNWEEARFSWNQQNPNNSIRNL